MKLVKTLPRRSKRLQIRNMRIKTTQNGKSVCKSRSAENDKSLSRHQIPLPPRKRFKVNQYYKNLE